MREIIMHTLQHILTRRFVTRAAPHETVLAAARRMAAASVGALVVLEEERLVGIFSERDLMTRVVVPGRDPATTTLAEVMTRHVVTAELLDRTNACEQKMRRSGCRHLPVLADQRVVAMLSMRDLLSDEIEEHAAENRALRDYLHQPSPVDSRQRA